tara:strand:+ start:426 stop:863 length:438 start_codon:yes stop_codon:yes gene_type:complete
MVVKIVRDELVKAVSGEYRTLQDISNQFGVTREGIRLSIIKFKLQNYSGRQRPDLRKTCSYCNEKVYWLDNTRNRNKFHAECKEKAVWSKPTCHICNTTFKIYTKVLDRSMAGRTSAWTKGIIFCSRQCYGRYLGSSFGKGNKIK